VEWVGAGMVYWRAGQRGEGEGRGSRRSDEVIEGADTDRRYLRYLSRYSGMLG
jgi:hypothetical protein